MSSSDFNTAVLATLTSDGILDIFTITKLLEPSAEQRVDRKRSGKSRRVGLLKLSLLRHRSWRWLGGSGTLLLAILGLPVQADDFSGWYGGVGLGWANTDASANEMERRLANRGFSTDVNLDDTSSIGWKLLAGYRGGEYWGVEASYVDLGDVTTRVTAQANSLGQLTDAVAKVQPFSVSGFSIGPVGYLPLGDQFLLSATAGPFFWWADSKAHLNSNGVSFTRHDSDSGVDWTIGAGAGYSPIPIVTLRLGWDYYKTSRYDQNLFSAQVIYWFGR